MADESVNTFITQGELADALQEMRDALLRGLLAMTTGITPGADTASSLEPFGEALEKIQMRIDALRAEGK